MSTIFRRISVWRGQAVETGERLNICSDSGLATSALVQVNT